MSDEITATAEVASTETPTTEQAAVDTQESIQSTETTATEQQTETATGPSNEDLLKIIDRQNKDIGRLANTLKTFQGKSTTNAATPQESTKTTNDGNVHPALKGLTPDGDGEYSVNGKFYSADELIERYETKQQLKEISDWKESLQTEKETQQILAAEEQLRGYINDSVKDMTSELLPGTPADKIDIVNRNTVRAVEDIIRTKLGSGEELNEQLIKSALTDAVTEQRSLYSIWAVSQAKGNQEYKENNPDKPGTPGVASMPQNILTLPESERQGYIQRAMNALKRGGG